MIDVVTYDAARKGEWDSFVDAGKNGTFLFRRDYMEYHADRFTDFSRLFFANGELVAVLPANVAGDEVSSHAGLTFGGIICGRRMRTATMLEVFDALGAHLRGAGIRKVIWKRVPHIYHDIPSDEDVYALFRNGAVVSRRDVSAALLQDDRPPYAKGRKWCVNKSRKNGLTVGRSSDISGFMALETFHLESKFGVKPVHTAAEMELLASRFPENIKLFTATRDGVLLAGVLVYETRNVAHAQYIGSTAEGRDACALDAVVDHLLNDVYRSKLYFDFGTSNEENGRVLNQSLIENKESYGARAVVHEFFEWTL